MFVYCVLFFVCVYLRLRISSHPKSIAGVQFDSVRRFRATLLLRTTCMRLCCNGGASCVAPTNKNHPPAWYSVPWRDSPENHSSVVQLPGVVHTLRWESHSIGKECWAIFCGTDFFVFLVFPGFSGVHAGGPGGSQGLEDDFVKMCGVQQDRRW